MLQLMQRILNLDWRRRGGVMREVPIAGCHVWYAEFRPKLADLQELRHVARRARARGEAGAVARPPTLVLFHGLGASSTSFYPVIEHLRRGYRVIVPDLPGYGWSRTPKGREYLAFSELVDVAEKFVARVAPRGAYLAGNSMGGWISAKIASRRPDLVRGLALLNPGGPALRTEDWVDFARVVLAEEKGSIEEWLSRMFHKTPLHMRLMSRDFRRIMRGPSVAQLMGSLQDHDFLSDEEMARVKGPSVLVWGENDRLIPEGCKAFYLKKLKGVRYEPVPDCGHCPQLECPDRTADILLQLPSLAQKEEERLRGLAGPVPAVPQRRRRVKALARAATRG